ncbi:DNA-directed RNA polymerase subunit A' [archaeon]|nr:DNA-directed RNA polymerase subunit A' [archaeon]
MINHHVHKKIGQIQFGLMSPHQIKKMALAKVVTPELYDKEGYPVDGGLMDVRLGVIDPGLRCKSCGGKLKECLGHFGNIELARPVLHIKYVDTILHVLRSTCRECARVLHNEAKIKELKDSLSDNPVLLAEQLREMREISKKLKTAKKCPHCEVEQKPVKLDKPLTMVEDNQNLSPVEVRARLESVSDDDVLLLGLNPKFARPEWTVLTLLSIPPVTVRPSITLETGERSEDDLTHKLGDIVRINQRLFENINAGAPEIIVEDLWELLQYHVTTYFDNTLANVPPARHRSGQSLKTLTERIKSKEGRFRHNLAGKRVNFAARTVISPDPKIGFNEVGIPKKIAMTLTVPEMITTWNIDYLKKLIDRGPKSYPGANYIIFEDGKKRNITDETKEQLLQEVTIGCIVERHIIDGDISVFNRQPSLHRMSIMAHKVRVLPGKSFRLNPAICNPYNADFDGDEMNLHIPQTEEARSEAEVLMPVETQIITPKNGLNVIGCIEDSISGIYLLTKKLSFTREKACELLYSVGVKTPRLPQRATVTGKEVFSSVLPKNFSFVGRSSDGEARVVIKRGNLESGIIDKNSIGEDNGDLIRELYKLYGDERAITILGKLFRLGTEVLLRTGFTITTADSEISSELLDQAQEQIKKANKAVKDIIQQFEEGKLESMPGLTPEDSVEMKILEILNKVRDTIGGLVFKETDHDNPIIIMAESGAKGKKLNLTQMSACVGQQALRGKRISEGYNNRTLSHFKAGDRSPMARGFIEGGFKSGLKPHEFFFAAMTGRDSLMDTALRTPKSGYLYRRLANALQDLKVEYDNTVRDANKMIMQFSYGEDALDVAKTEGGKLNIQRILDSIKK